MARLYGHYVPGDPGPIQDGRALDEQIKDLFWADTRLMKGEGEMKVTTVSASVRFSKALGDGVHKTVELSAAAALQGQETRAEAQANLYQQLGQQLKTLWDNGKSALDAPQSPERAAISAHYCEMSTG